MAKVDIYECNKCKRTTEIDQNHRRPHLPLCTITMHCNGELIKIGENNTRSLIASPVKYGVTNWAPREIKDTQYTEIFSVSNDNLVDGQMDFITRKSFSITENDIDVKINGAKVPFTKKSINEFSLLFPVSKLDVLEVVYLKTAGNDVSTLLPEEPAMAVEMQTGPGVLTIAVPEEYAHAWTITCMLTEHNKENSGFRKYIYVRPAGTTLVSGADDSVGKAALYFSESSAVTILIDGVKIDQSKYTLVGNNTITFNTPFTNEKTYVEIMVYSTVVSDETEEYFEREAHYVRSAWHNVRDILIDGQKYVIYQSSDMVGRLKLNTKFNIRFNAPGIKMLFARPPYTTFDRIYNIVYNAKSESNSDYIIGTLIAKSNEFKISIHTNDISDMNTPIVIESRFMTDSINADASYASEAYEEIGDKIIGPSI